MFLSFLRNIKRNRELSSERKRQLKELCAKLGIRIRALWLLDRALTHSSFVEKSSHNVYSYERMEFLGDSILNASVSYHLYLSNPMFMEGKLSALRASVVDEKTLSEIGFSIGLQDYINLGRGERLSDIRARIKVTADIVESIIAVIFLEKGFRAAFRFVRKLLDAHLVQRLTNGTNDYKTMLQKLSIEKYKEYPVYQVIEESGPDHNKVFQVEVRVKDNTSAIAAGRSKKEAEQKAAAIVLEKMRGQRLNGEG